MMLGEMSVFTTHLEQNPRIISRLVLDVPIETIMAKNNILIQQTLIRG